VKISTTVIKTIQLMMYKATAALCSAQSERHVTVLNGKAAGT
jgi:hypothetical protein